MSGREADYELSLLEALREWIAMKEKGPLHKLTSGAVPMDEVRFAQGQLAAFRAMAQTLALPSERLKRFLREPERDDIPR